MNRIFAPGILVAVVGLSVATPAQNIENGKNQFKTRGCVSCHSYSGQGGAGARLAQNPITFQAFVNYVRKPKGTMPSYGNQIPDVELADIYAYIKSVPPPQDPKTIPLLSQIASAQGTDDSRPAPTNVRGAEYPRIHSDNRVTFRLKALEARKVQLQPNDGAVDNGLGKGPYDMVRGNDGVWSVTTPPAVPGLHLYDFLVDGVAVNDPGSEAFISGRATSGIEVPEKGVDFYLPQDVPHGVVQEFWYHSKLTAEWRHAYVYTPPEYDRDFRVRYPVVYLQHGGNGDPIGWVRGGRVNFIIDNLLAAKKAVPMLVVMEHGYANRPGDGPDAPDVFEDLVIQDLIPTIDNHYRTLTDREHRAIAGLSRGGNQALQIGVGHLDTFAYIGDFSGGFSAREFKPETSYNGIFRKPELLNSRLKLLWVGTATAELYYQYLKPFHETLDKLGVTHIYYESPGTSHEWLTWRRHLNEFAPRLFH